jgi:hypothetical protein
MVEKANKRELILAAAREIFGEKGITAPRRRRLQRKPVSGKEPFISILKASRIFFYRCICSI